MPKDPIQPEVKEVVGRQGAAAVAEPDPDEVRAAEVFGEEVETDPFATLDNVKTKAAKRREEEARLKKEADERKEHERQLQLASKNLGQGLEKVGEVASLVEIAKLAYKQDQEKLGDQLQALLKKYKSIPPLHVLEPLLMGMIGLNLPPSLKTLVYGYGKTYMEQSQEAFKRVLREKGIDRSDYEKRWGIEAHTKVAQGYGRRPEEIQDGWENVRRAEAETTKYRHWF